jgi:glutathione synthase/RimK-type ligase-like ATP-grasp enzyme
MSVLIITKSDDNESVGMVAEAVRARGGRAFRFDTDRFPSEIGLVARYGPGGAERLALVAGEEEVDLGEVTALWHRRLHIAGRLPREMDAQLRAASAGEARATVMGLLSALEVFRLDPEENIRRAGHKQLQLRLARESGLEVPRTLITNDAAAVRDFAASCPGPIVTKMMSSFAVYDAGGRERVVFTNEVTPADLADLDGLRLCPMTFQERVEKAAELRVTVVGRKVFTASVNSQASPLAADDWRRDGLGLVESWEADELPRGVEEALLRLMDAFGLNYGAADFIRTPDGRHVFLEVNPSGEFFWLERRPGLPISAAIADLLLSSKKQ